MDVLRDAVELITWFTAGPQADPYFYSKQAAQTRRLAWFRDRLAAQWPDFAGLRIIEEVHAKIAARGVMQGFQGFQEQKSESLP